MNNCLIILAAGKSSRFNSNKPKQYTNYRDNLVINHSIITAHNSKLFKKIIVVVNKSHKKYIKYIQSKNTKIIFGGKERHISSYLALKYLNKFKINKVFIHDAARPNMSVNLLKKLNKYIKLYKAVIPFVKINDSIKYKKKDKIINLIRDNVYITQTPQCFDFKYIFNLAKKNKLKITDESSLVINNKDNLKFIQGEKDNFKITNIDNLRKSDKKTFYGIGFDIHRLIPGKKLYLGGLKIKSRIGTLGHSDGDPVLHAVTDSILGAIRKGDIGDKFPDNNKRYKNIRSTILLKKIIYLLKINNYNINNIDINIITQTPKIKKYKSKIIKIISKICNINENQVNIKGKTTEKLGLIGQEKAIACEVITSINKYV